MLISNSRSARLAADQVYLQMAFSRVQARSESCLFTSRSSRRFQSQIKSEQISNELEASNNDNDIDSNRIKRAQNTFRRATRVDDVQRH